MKLFVTGGSGFIGSHFCAMAVEKGHQVQALVRPASAGRIQPGVQRIYGQLPYDVPANAVEQSDVVVHLAAITTAQLASEARAVNEYGTEYLLKLARTGNTGFIFTSTQSAHGENISAYATTKRQCEAMIKQSGLPWAILRPGLVYGPGETGLFARMRSMVRRLPVLPLLGGGKALVQPIHVDDLCQAILTIVDDFRTHSGSELNLGDPAGLPLKEFLRMVSKSDGAKSRQLNMPLMPVKAVVSVAERLRMPLPVSMDNLRGLETVQRMETAASLEQLDLTLRDLEQGLRQSVEPTLRMQDDRIPVLLVGAGKIGIVHGLQITNNPLTRLVGIIEPNQKSAKLYESMGFNAPFHTSLAAALEAQDKPAAAVVATPADTHLAVSRQCLEAGLHVLVEKPLSVNAEIAEQWHALRNEHPDAIIHSGYMAAQFPQLLTAYHFARMNKLGHIYKARLVALQTHITASEPVRWEMLKARSGGGVMINFGCHVASMLFRLLGWPDTEATGWQWPVYSTEVEDALIAKFEIRSTQCTLVTSWSVAGFARPYNLVELECERGTLRVENSGIYVIQDGEATLIETQLDYPLAFNMAPDYTGGGFALEHEAFANAISSLNASTSQGLKMKYMPPVEMPEALRLENWIRTLYDSLSAEKPGLLELKEIGIPDDISHKILSAGRAEK